MRGSCKAFVFNEGQNEVSTATHLYVLLRIRNRVKTKDTHFVQNYWKQNLFLFFLFFLFFFFLFFFWIFLFLFFGFFSDFFEFSSKTLILKIVTFFKWNRKKNMRLWVDALERNRRKWTKHTRLRIDTSKRNRRKGKRNTRLRVDALERNRRKIRDSGLMLPNGIVEKYKTPGWYSRTES